MSVDSIPSPVFPGYLPPRTRTPPASAAMGWPSIAPPPFGKLGPKVLLTIPVYNEVRFVRSTVEALDLALASSGINYTLSVAEDGSTDGTKEVLSRLKMEIPDLVVRMVPQKLGRGKALRQFWAGFDMDFYAFCDTDLATDPETLVAILRKAIAGENIVVGSRYVPGAVVDRPPMRSLVSRVYNWYVRNTFRDRIQDHQCGLKVFSRKALRELVWDTHEDSWFWDTEVLVLAKHRGYEVAEVPVEWVERKSRHTSLRRLLSDVNLHGLGLLRLKASLESQDPFPRAKRARTDDPRTLERA